jgi:hypothetical protein
LVGTLDPSQLQVLDVCRCDLRERAVPSPIQVSGIGEPILGLPFGVQNAIEGYRRSWSAICDCREGVRRVGNAPCRELPPS